MIYNLVKDVVYSVLTALVLLTVAVAVFATVMMFSQGVPFLNAFAYLFGVVWIAPEPHMFGGRIVFLMMLFMIYFGIKAD